MTAQPDGPPSENERLANLHLTPKAHAAVLETVVRDAVTTTDAINRLVQLGNALSKLEPGDKMQWTDCEGNKHTVHRPLDRKSRWKRFLNAIGEALEDD